jgi:hypothetical protein
MNGYKLEFLQECTARLSHEGNVLLREEMCVMMCLYADEDGAPVVAFGGALEAPCRVRFFVNLDCVKLPSADLPACALIIAASSFHSPMVAHFAHFSKVLLFLPVTRNPA